MALGTYGHASHRGSDGDLASGSASLPQSFPRLQNTMVLHTVQNNAIRLPNYLVQLLSGGYGTASPLHIACWRGSVEAVEALVESAPPEHIQDCHRPGELTPLHVSTICGHVDVVHYLLSQGADPNVPTVHGLRALHIAASQSEDLVETLLAHGADPDALSADRDSPMHFACCFHQELTVELLLRHNAAPALQNAFGVSPLEILCAYGPQDLADAEGMLLLCSHGADVGMRDHHGKSCMEILDIAAGGDGEVLAFFQDQMHRIQEAAEALLAQRATDREDRSVREAAFSSAAGDAGASLDRTPRQLGVARQASGAAKGKTLQALEENQRLRAELGDVRRELEEGRREHRLLEAKMRNSESMLSQMRKQNAASVAETSDEVERLKRQLESERRQLRSCAAEPQDQRLGESRKLAEAATEAEQARVREGFEMERVEFRGQISQLRNQLEEEKAQHARELAAFSASNTQNEESNDGQIQALQAELTHAERRFGEVRAELDAAREELRGLRSALGTRDADLAAARAEAQGSSAEAEEERQDKLRLQAKVVELEDMLAELRDQLSTQSREHSQFRLACQEDQVRAEGSINELELVKAKLEEDLLQCREELEHMEVLRQRAERADRLLAPFEERIRELQEQFEREQQLRKRYHNRLQEAKGAIRVYARVRPISQREVDLNDQVAIEKQDAFSLKIRFPSSTKDPKSYIFDSIFDERSTQEDVYAECRDLVQSVLDGYNITIFAYGQTGAGKTHTMYGNAESPGLVPRMLREIFALIGKQSSRTMKHSVRCYMMELYRDDLVDLLAPRGRKGQGPPALEVKKDHRGNVIVEGVTERVTPTLADLERAIADGGDRRHVAATSMNSESSRSHLIFSIIVETVNESTKQVGFGKITMCDLAGSERIKKSEVTGDQMKEAQSINKSLTALGDVIEALSKGAKHIPYRNHKLTQLMSDSIGGNAKTLMFVNCSPALSNADESNSSLSYAARAKLITNKVEKHQDNKEVARLKQVIATMSQQMAANSTAVELPPLA